MKSIIEITIPKNIEGEVVFVKNIRKIGENILCERR
jgi:hypothetical protein